MDLGSAVLCPPDDPDTSELARRAHAGDGGAWPVLILRHGQGLRLLADRNLDRQLRGRVDPDDIVQDALLDAFQSLGRYLETRLSFAAWLRQRLQDRLFAIRRDHRAKMRDPRRETDPGTGWDGRLVAPDTSPSGRAERGERERSVGGALDRLDAIDQAIIRMHSSDGMPHEAIAARLGLKPATVRKRYSRALAQLGDALRRDKFEG